MPTLAPSKPRRPAPAREKLLDTAADLFYKRGVHDVGIDEIIARAGVAKMSLYHHFKSKDDLIVEFLRRRHDSWMSTFTARVQAVRITPRLRPLALFDALAEWFNEKTFRGCAFLNTAAELCDPRHPARAVCRHHKQALRDYILTLLEASNAKHPAELADHFLLLIEGAIVQAALTGAPTPAHQARAAAHTLLINA